MRTKEQEARDDLLGQIKAGDQIVVTKGPDKGIQGEVEGVLDGGKTINVVVVFPDPEERTCMYPKHYVRKVWPGLNPEQHPVGGWANLRARHEIRKPVPTLGQKVRHKERGGEGFVLRIGSSVIYKSITSVRSAKESELQVQNPDGSWSDFAADEIAKPAVPIKDLPEPFCQIREVRNNTEGQTRWSAHDADGNMITKLDIRGARNLKIQLFWEFGIEPEPILL